ncbi:MAG: hypothetical protein AVDCRST_MAG17-4, partial [uncultured Solirubrobacterales bacterium]
CRRSLMASAASTSGGDTAPFLAGWRKPRRRGPRTPRRRAYRRSPRI